MNAAEIMKERFGRDQLIALATCAEDVPSVRTVNAYYRDGYFYIVTYALSRKMKQSRRRRRAPRCRCHIGRADGAYNVFRYIHTLRDDFPKSFAEPRKQPNGSVGCRVAVGIESKSTAVRA